MDDNRAHKVKENCQPLPCEGRGADLSPGPSPAKGGEHSWRPFPPSLAGKGAGGLGDHPPRERGWWVRCGRAAGQSAVEFALSVPVFLALLLGLIYVGIIFYSQVTISNAARVGANYLARHPLATDEQVEQVIRSELGALSQAATTIEISPPREERVPYAQLDVTVRYRVPLPTIRIPSLDGGQIVLLGPLWLRASSTMNVE